MRKTENIELNASAEECPTCGDAAPRHSFGERDIISLNYDIHVKFPKFYCESCNKHWSHPIDSAPKGSRYSYAVRNAMLDIIKSEKCTMRAASRYMEKKYGLCISYQTIQSWMQEDR